MPSRPDIREISTNVREAFADADKETLLDVLTFVLKEYVVEGPPPMLIHQAETLSDLKGTSFAQLISALQTRFDHPELAMFVVDGESVGVRIGGVVQPLLPGRTPPASAQPAVDQLRAAGVRVVETTLSQRPPAPPQQAPSPPPQRQEGQAPPPVRGLSTRGAPTGGAAGPTQPPAQQQQPAPAAQPAQPDPAAPKEKPEGSGDDASTRFGLLELD
jgi:hypothetical protein